MEKDFHYRLLHHHILAVEDEKEMVTPNSSGCYSSMMSWAFDFRLVLTCHNQ